MSTGGRRPTTIQRVIGGAALAVAALIAAWPAGGLSAARAHEGWTFSATPTTLRVGVTREVEVLIESQAAQIGAIVVTIPSGYDIDDVSISGASGSWTVLPLDVGGSVTIVTIVGVDADDLLVAGDDAKLRFDVTATDTGLGPWRIETFELNVLTSTSNGWEDLSFTIRPAATPTPTPKPTPTPTTQPTPTPTAIPTPTPGSTATPTTGPTPSPHPTATTPSTPKPTPKPDATPGDEPTPTPDRSTSRPSASPDSTPQAAATATPEPDESESPSRPPSADPTGEPAPSDPPVAVGAIDDPGDGSGGLQVVDLAPAAAVEVGELDLARSMGQFTWLIPGFFLGLPGLLVVLVVAAQTLGAGVLAAITRRSLGGVER
jgi:hypothetical protein